MKHIIILHLIFVIAASPLTVPHVTSIHQSGHSPITLSTITMPNHPVVMEASAESLAPPPAFTHCQPMHLASKA
jgi:hypothetical protein